MAKQDDYVRITLRLPPELHRDLTALAGVKSMNAYIVENLDEIVRIAKDRLAAAEEEGAWVGKHEPSSVMDLDNKISNDRRMRLVERDFFEILNRAGLKLISISPGDDSSDVEN